MDLSVKHLLSANVRVNVTLYLQSIVLHYVAIFAITLHMQCYCMEQNAGDTDIADCRYCDVAIILKYCPTLDRTILLLLIVVQYVIHDHYRT